MLLPARMAVLNYLNKVKDASVEEIMTAMKPQYGREGQFTKNVSESRNGIGGKRNVRSGWI